MFLSQCENLSPGILKQKNGLLEWHTELGRVHILNYVGAFGSVCSGDLIFFFAYILWFGFLLVCCFHVLWNFEWDLDKIRWGFEQPGLRKGGPAYGRRIGTR